MNQFFAHTISAWTLPGGISCDDDDDQKRLERFLGKFPPLVDALAQRIASAPVAANDVTAPSRPPGLLLPVPD